MKYKSVLVTKRGGPEVLQVTENELRLPLAREARIKVLATGVGRTDINCRSGKAAEFYGITALYMRDKKALHGRFATIVQSARGREN